MIESILHTALRLATGAYLTCSINSLLFKTKQMALETRRKFLTLKYAIKISSTSNNPIYNNIFPNRYKALYYNKPKFPFSFYIRLNKILQTTFKIYHHRT